MIIKKSAYFQTNKKPPLEDKDSGIVLASMSNKEFRDINNYDYYENKYLSQRKENKRRGGFIPFFLMVLYLHFLVNFNILLCSTQNKHIYTEMEVEHHIQENGHL